MPGEGIVRPVSLRIPAQSRCRRSASPVASPGRTRIVARFASCLAPAGLCLLLLAGCGSSGSDVPEDRQFASNARTVSAEDPTATVAASAPTGPSGADGSAPSAQPANPLSTRGAPADAVTWDGASLTVIALSGGAPTLVPIPLALTDGETVRDVASSPSGDRFAVLTSDALRTPASLRVALYGRDGARIAGPVALAAAATPVASPVAGATPVATPDPASAGDGTGARLVSPPSTLTWSPAGDALIVNEAGVAVAILDLSGDELTAGETIAIPSSAGTVAGAWMSPRGDRLLLTLDDASGRRAIATIALGGADRRPQVVWPGTDERARKSVREAAWLPDGTGIVFTTEQGAESGAGNLYAVSLTDLEPRVLATSGRGGPSARVGTFAVSPDGKSIAYTLETPDGDGWSFHSLWARSLRDGASVEMSAANGAVVSQPVWTRAGLLWEQADPDGAHGELMLARPDGTAGPIAIRDGTRWVLAGPAPASPAASPVGTPAASPVASPAASPVASPVSTQATPEGSPAA